MQYLLALFEKYAAALYTPPFEAKVASNFNTFLSNTTLAQRVWRRFKRDLALALTGQFFCQHASIPANAKRVLYVYLGMPQLGDSIMDLSARTLWAQRGLEVDLFTHASVASFYEGDPSFARVLSNRADLAKSYDFVVLQSYNWKCLKLKWRHFLTTPFLSLHGHYYGPEFNRFDFARQAWARALGLAKNDPQLNSVRSVFNLKLRHTNVQRSKGLIAIALGGVVSWRTYTHWLEVMKEVELQTPEVNWLLLGSENGEPIANEVMQYFSSVGQAHRVDNQVNKLQLPQVFEKLQTVQLLVAADGGLMHLGNASQAEIVALFAGPIHPRMRFQAFDAANVMHAKESVQNISSNDISQLILRSLSEQTKSLSVKYVNSEPECSGI